MVVHGFYEMEEFHRAFPHETDQIEFKSGFGQTPLQEAAVALSNTKGGVILIGVDDNGSVLGAVLNRGNETKAHEAMLSAHDMGRYEVGVSSVGDASIVSIRVHPTKEGFAQTSSGRVLVRRGARNHALLGADLTRFLSQRAFDRFESTESRVRLAEVDPSLLSELAHARGWPIDDSVPDRLNERGLATGDRLTIAGALLLTHPARSLDLQKCVIEVRRYPREDVDYDRRETFGGPLHHQVQEASRFVSDELGSELVVAGPYRHELPKVPGVVVRESIANAVAHRSYEIDRTPIVVELRENRVVVRSPGRLPEPVTVATMRAAQAARNPQIIETLRAFSLTEDAGRGVDVMQDTMREALLNPPEFADDDGFVTVTLYLNGPITPRERAWVQDLVGRGALAPEDRWVLIHAARGEVMSNSTAREALNTADSGEARRALQRLRDAGLLVQHGERSGARYTLARDIAPPVSPRSLASASRRSR